MIKDPEPGDFVKLSGKILSIHEGTALVKVYRSDPVGIRVAVQCGALEHVEPVEGGGEAPADTAAAVTVKTDDQVRASYARLRPDGKVARTVEVSDSVMVDVDAEGRPVGVETLDGSDWTGALVTLAIRGRLRIT